MIHASVHYEIEIADCDLKWQGRPPRVFTVLDVGRDAAIVRVREPFDVRPLRQLVLCGNPGRHGDRDPLELDRAREASHRAITGSAPASHDSAIAGVDPCLSCANRAVGTRRCC